MLQISKDLCLGCGFCAQNCPQGAIYVVWRQLQIDFRKCNSCGLCLEICPQGAITETTIISVEALIKETQALQEQTEAILARINRLSLTSSKNQ